MLWPIVWISGMLALIIATTVVAMREKKARKKALANMQPQPLDPGLEGDADPMAAPADDGFGVDDGFGAAADDMAELDENAFK